MSFLPGQEPLLKREPNVTARLSSAQEHCLFLQEAGISPLAARLFCERPRVSSRAVLSVPLQFSYYLVLREDIFTPSSEEWCYVGYNFFFFFNVSEPFSQDTGLLSLVAFSSLLKSFYLQTVKTLGKLVAGNKFVWVSPPPELQHLVLPFRFPIDSSKQAFLYCLALG